MPDPSGLSIQTTGGALPDVAVAQVIQRKAKRLTDILGDANQPAAFRNSAKVAFDALRLAARQVGLEVTYDAPPPPAGGPAVTRSGIDQTIGDAIQQGGSAVLHGVGDATQGVLDATAPGAPVQGPVEQSGVFRATPVAPADRAAAIQRMATDAPLPPGSEPGPPSPVPLGPPAPVPAQTATAAPPPEPLGPPQPATRLSDSGIAPAPPLDLSAPPPEPDSADTLALRAALAAPAPVYQRPTYTKGEGVAMAFLAGLKGFDAVLPFIKLKEEQATRAAQTGLEARGQTISGLHGLAAVGEAGKDRAENMRLRYATMQSNLEMRRMTTEFQAERLGILAHNAQRADFLATLAGRKFNRPPQGTLDQLEYLGNVIDAAQRLRPLIAAGGGGPVAGSLAKSDWLSWMTSEQTIQGAARWGVLMTYFGPKVAGRNITQLEVGRVGAGLLDVGISSNKTRQLAAIDRILEAAQRDKERFASVYDPEFIYNFTGTQPMGGTPSGRAAPKPLPDGLQMIPTDGGDVSLYEPDELGSEQ